MKQHAAHAGSVPSSAVVMHRRHEQRSKHPIHLTHVGADRALPADTFVRLVHQQSPTLPVVAIVHLTSADLRALLRIAPIGVEGVIAVGVDSPWSVLQSVLTSPAVEASIETVLTALRPRVTDGAWPFVTSVVRAVKTPVTVDEFRYSPTVPVAQPVTEIV